VNLYNFFLNLDRFKELKSFEVVDELYKGKLVVDISLFLSFVIFFIFTYRYFFLSVETVSLFFLFITAILLIIGLFYIKITGNLKLQAWVILFVAITVLPIRAYYTGGAIAPNISWFGSSIVIVAILHSKKTTILFTSFMILALATLHFVKIPNEFHTPAAGRFIIHLTAFIVALHSILRMTSAHRFIITESKKLEKYQVINTMMTTLSHELNNPLAIAKGNTYLLKEKYANEIMLEKVDHSLDRMANVVKKITSLNDAQQIKTESYAGDKNQMYSLHIE
jgi:signal transduction histidine kinase